MMTGGSPILGNLHLWSLMVISCDFYPNDSRKKRKALQSSNNVIVCNYQESSYTNIHQHQQQIM